MFGGVEFVNKALAEGFLSRGNETGVYSMRRLGKDEYIKLDDRIATRLINENDLVERPSNNLAIAYLKEFKLLKFFSQMRKIAVYFLKMRRDYFRMSKAVREYAPDIIIVSYAYMLDCVPRRMLKQTIMHVHTTFDFYRKNRFMHGPINRYKHRVKNVVWVANASAQAAVESGIDNAVAIHNPLKFTSEQSANIINNRKAIYIGRISPEKQVDLIVSMFNDVVREADIRDWTLEIYGSGKLSLESQRILNDNEYVVHKGNTDDVREALLGASLLLIASKYESFSLAVFEANECGVPALAFDFGEATKEAIVDKKTGIVVDKNDIKEYKNQIKILMENPEKIAEMSLDAKMHAKLAGIDSILDKWSKLLLE